MSGELQPGEISGAHRVIERQYDGFGAINTNARLNTIDESVIDGRNLRYEMVETIDAPPDGTVLDIGCADGKLLGHLRSLGYRGQAIGLDVDLSSLELAKRHGSAQDTMSDFIQGNMESLPFRDASIDSVFCSFTLHHADDPFRVLQEIWRVLVPGGQLVISANSEHQKRLHYEILDAIGQRLHVIAPQPFAKNFSTENAPALLARLFTIEQVIPQESEMHFHEEDIPSILISLQTYMSEFTPPIINVDPWRFAEKTVVRRHLDKNAVDGVIKDNVSRKFYVCRKSSLESTQSEPR